METVTVSILGTLYKIITKKYDEEESFKRRHIDAFCDGCGKEIVLCDMSTYEGWEHENLDDLAAYRKGKLKHEIVHAFLFESGLAQHSGNTDAWALNEEMVDWIALQGTKIYAAWQETGVL
jgi:hypothetical protein